MDFIKTLLEYVGVFFVLYLFGYSTFLFLSVAVGSSVLYKQRQMQQLYNELKHDYYIPVSIIVPAYNEEMTVVDTVISLLNLDYKLYEIIVVDDGSKDSTSESLIQYFNMVKIERPIHKRIFSKDEKFIYMSRDQKVPVTLIKKENGGKADTLNMGINASRYPYFICMDADSVLQEDALENIMRPLLEDSKIIACGGMVRIANGISFDRGKVMEYKLPKKLIVGMQVLEYDRSFLASRILLDQFNGNLIISGAFGLFKKDIVVAAGGYDHSTMGEDMELVLKLHVYCRTHRIPYAIKYVPDAICWSQAPELISDLKKQRKRWYLGLFQSMWKHKQLFFNPKYGLVSFVSFLYFLLYELFSPFIELFGLITIAIAFAVNLINVPFMLLFFFIYVSFGVILSLTAFFARMHTNNVKLTKFEVAKAIYFCMLENMGLRFIMAWVRMTAFIGYKKKKNQWGSIKRYKMDMNK